jgi:L-rhamnose isomerase
MRRREQLGRSLDDIFSVSHDRECLADSVESKLFGIGSEAFVAGSHEFYMQWVTEHNLMKNDNVMVCLDMGHFHPTESVADKISSMLLFQKALLIHASRGIRWDSDHVTAFDDSMKDLMMEIVCADAIKRCFISLDYFDASINRVGALVAGARSTLMSMLYALLLPVGKIRECELAEDGIGRLAIFEASKAMPFGAVWDYWCLSKNVPAGADWLMGIYKYEKDILSKR